MNNGRGLEGGVLIVGNNAAKINMSSYLLYHPSHIPRGAVGCPNTKMAWLNLPEYMQLVYNLK